MSVIGNNIRKIRLLNNLTQTSFAAIFNVNRSNISAYEDGRANPKNDLLLKICAHFNISVEKFSSKELTVNQLSNYNDSLIVNNQEAIKTQVSFPFVSEKSLLQYVKRQRKEDFRLKLPKFTFPLSIGGMIQAFEISNHELMELPDKCTVICKKITINNIQKEQKSQLCFVIFKNSSKLGYVSVKNEEISLQFSSENQEIMIPKNEMVELWKVIGVLNMQLNLSSIHHHIQVLNKRISEMNEKTK